ncbi:MAG: hypothetical protein GY822_14955 [Deltaproteobacteria bacterium]|nr:hypothetical protein [Deltaproteobacteria bacterium]
MGIGDKVKSEGMKAGMKAMSKLMEQPERAQKVMKVIEGVQKSKDAIDDTTASIRNLGQLPSKTDVKELSRKVGRLKREGKKVLALIDDIEERLDV